MPHDPARYDKMCAALGVADGLSEKKMFGGVCFLLHGHMVAGVFRDRGMARVGKAREADALAIDGVDAYTPTGRKMGGIVGLTPEIFDDDAALCAVLSLALGHASTLPPK